MVLDQRTFKSLAFILNESQDSHAAHPKLIQKCLKIYQETEFSLFFDTFTIAIQPMLITMQKNPHVDRCIDFVAKFCASLNPQQPEEASQMDIDETQSDLNNQFLSNLINHLIEINKANCDAVRYRVCHLLGKLMSVISNDQSIDEDLFDRLCDAMLERLKDINSRVQVQAVSAIYRLQDPNDRDCRVIKALLFLMSYDPHWTVRFQALANIAFSKQTLPEIIDRVRDPHPQVRRKAILILSEKVLIKFISIEKRLFILNYALKDQDQSVVDACSKKLLPSWLAFKENDMCKLLKALDVVDSSQTCEMMMDKMHSDNSLETLCNDFMPLLNDKHVLPLDKLDAESIFYWQWICSKCQKQSDNKRTDGDVTQQIDGQEHLDTLVPSLTEMCLYVEEAFKKIEADRLEKQNDDRFQIESIFVLKKLIEMFSFADFSDAHGKKSLHTFCHKIFSNKNHMILYETMFKIYKKLHPNLQTRVNNLVELISDIKDPNPTATQQVVNETITEDQNETEQSDPDLPSPQEIQFKISELKFKRFSLKDDFDKLYSEFKNVNKTVDMNHLNEIRNQIKEVEDQIADLQAKLVETPKTVVAPSAPQEKEKEVAVAEEVEDPVEIAFHCLNIAVCLLEDIELKSLTPQIRSMCDSLIIPNISSVNEDLRAMAVCALGLVCILKLEMAQKYVPLFLEVIQRDKKEIVIEAFKAMINCIMAFSVKKLVESDEEEMVVEATSKMMGVMTSLLDHDESDVYTLAVEGFCKLYMTGHILSAKLFSKLLIMYYSPLTEKDVKLRAFLSAFLPQFAFFRACNQLCVEESFMITLKCLINAPADSYLSSIDLIKVMETVFNLINPKNLIQKNHTNICHENVVKSICYEILKDENSFKCKTYLKILQMAELNDADYLSLKNIHELADEVHEHIDDKTIKKMAKKFQETVFEILSKKPEHKNEPAQKTIVEPTETSVRQEEAESTSQIDQNESVSSEMIDYEFPKITKKNKSNKTLTRTLNETNKTVVDQTHTARRSSPRISRVRESTSNTSQNSTLNESRKSLEDSSRLSMKEVRIVLNKIDDSLCHKSNVNESNDGSTLIDTDSESESDQENSKSKKLKLDSSKGPLKRGNKQPRSKSQVVSQDEEPPSKVARGTRSKTSVTETRSLRSKTNEPSTNNTLNVTSANTRASSNSRTRSDLRRSPRSSRNK